MCIIVNKWIVIVITLLLTTFASVYLFRQPEIYKAQAGIQAHSEANARPSRTAKDPSPFNDRAYFNTQL